MPKLYTPDDVAEMIGKTADYWSRKARAKAVEHVRIGQSIRFTAEQVDAIVVAATVQAKQTAANPQGENVVNMPTSVGVDVMAAAVATRGRRAVAR